MKTDSRVWGGPSAHGYRHPLLSCIRVFLQWLATVVDEYRDPGAPGSWSGLAV